MLLVMHFVNAFTLIVRCSGSLFLFWCMFHQQSLPATVLTVATGSWVVLWKKQKYGNAITKEIDTPYGFRLDTSPSPLHPALQANANANILGGINPFRSQRWDMSSMRNPSDQLEPERVLCSLLQTKPASHTFNEVGSNPALDSICTAPLAGNLGMSMLTACMEESWRKSGTFQDSEKCSIILGKCVFSVEYGGILVQSYPEKALKGLVRDRHCL